MTDDITAIHNLLASYCFAIDDGDLEAYADLFDDAAFVIEAKREIRVEGRDAMRKFISRTILYDGVPRTKHLLSNVSIRLDGDDAEVRSYVTLLQAVPPEFPLQLLVSGSYRDRLVRKGDQWRFAERRMRPDLLGDFTFHTG